MVPGLGLGLGKDQRRHGFQKEIHPTIRVGGMGGKGSEEAAADIFDDFAWLGYMGTLDFSLCYDYMHPEVSCRVLEKLGWPRGLREILKDVWRNQKRWMYWDNQVAEEPLKTGSASPQGHPWGPILLNI